MVFPWPFITLEDNEISITSGHLTFASSWKSQVLFSHSWVTWGASGQTQNITQSLFCSPYVSVIFIFLNTEVTFSVIIEVLLFCLVHLLVKHEKINLFVSEGYKSSTKSSSKSRAPTSSTEEAFLRGARYTAWKRKHICMKIHK